MPYFWTKKIQSVKGKTVASVPEVRDAVIFVDIPIVEEPVPVAVEVPIVEEPVPVAVEVPIVEEPVPTPAEEKTETDETVE